jgi:hypothetical protein
MGTGTDGQEADADDGTGRPEPTSRVRPERRILHQHGGIRGNHRGRNHSMTSVAESQGLRAQMPVVRSS